MTDSQFNRLSFYLGVNTGLLIVLIALILAQ
jgi:hypothetical protein